MSLEAAAAAEAEAVAEVEAASEAFATCLWERTRPLRVWEGCLPGEAWVAGL